MPGQDFNNASGVTPNRPATVLTRASKRGAGRRVGYTYLHSALDGHTRLAYTEALADERATTTIGFFSRARVFFTAHGISQIERVVTDNGNNYRAAAFTRTVQGLAARHQCIRSYTPRHNGKIERYKRLLVDEVLYAKAYDSEQARRQAVQVWVNHYNYHRPHTACGDQAPASSTPASVNNVTPSYTQGPLSAALTLPPHPHPKKSPLIIARSYLRAHMAG